MPAPAPLPLFSAIHPLLVRVLRDLQLVEGTPRLSEERFEFWAKHLALRYPRAEHATLYEQLEHLSLQLALARAPAAAQLFGLASLGLSDWQRDRRSGGDAFLTGEESRGIIRLACDMASSCRVSGPSGTRLDLRPSTAPVRALGLTAA